MLRSSEESKCVCLSRYFHLLPTELHTVLSNLFMDKHGAGVEWAMSGWKVDVTA